MENEIKVGEYIRTEFGEIGQVFAIEENPKRYFYDEYGNNVIENSIVKHSPNLIDIIEDNDFCKIEFYSPRYKKRGTRIFEVSKIDEYITFENMHCDLFMKNGEWGNHDKDLNPIIKEIYTKEMMDSISYKVKRKD